MGKVVKDISVIIQSFERPDALGPCISYLQENLFSNLTKLSYELIIADDGSRKKEVLKILDESNCSKVFQNIPKTKGPGYTLNKACEMAEGKYIIHVEDDFWLVHPIREKHLRVYFTAFKKIPNLELIRLRRIIGDNAENYRLDEYKNKTEKKIYEFNKMEFRIFKPYSRGGVSYQYTGNAHIRRRSTLSKIHYYPENQSIWGLENTMASRFRKANFKTGRFFDGWFTHIGDKTGTTKQIKGVYK